MNAQHTPGPWHGGKLREGGGWPGVDVGADDGSNIALVWHDPTDRIALETIANAQLIAAAPDLLEVLKITAGNIRSLGAAGVLPEPYTVWLSEVESAIEKARRRA